MDLAEAPTPSLVLDRTKLQKNCNRQIEKCRQLGVGLRPHMKTLKSIDAARIALDPLHGGIAVSTLREAEYFLRHGIVDIQLAVCVAPDKLARAALISNAASRFSFFVESVAIAKDVAAYARTHNVPFRVWIEIDSGEHRTGIDPNSPDLVATARAFADSPVIVEGIATHAGHSYGQFSSRRMSELALEEQDAARTAANRIRDTVGGQLRISVGSSPTAAHAPSAAGISEYRAGVYMAGDVFQAAIGTLDEADIAVSVLATVISQNRERRRIVLDAGGLALSKDRSTSGLAVGDAGYGRVEGLNGGRFPGDPVIAEVFQEHGEIRDATNELLDLLPAGTKVRVLPNHACMTAAMYDEYLVTAGETAITDRWSRINGWS